MARHQQHPGVVHVWAEARKQTAPMLNKWRTKALHSLKQSLPLALGPNISGLLSRIAWRKHFRTKISFTICLQRFTRYLKNKLLPQKTHQTEKSLNLQSLYFNHTKRMTGPCPTVLRHTKRHYCLRCKEGMNIDNHFVDLFSNDQKNTLSLRCNDSAIVADNNKNTTTQHWL